MYNRQKTRYFTSSIFPSLMTSSEFFFSRNEDNLLGWNEAMGDKVNFKFVLFFDCDQRTCIER